MKYVLPGLGNWINTRNVLDGRSQVEYISSVVFVCKSRFRLDCKNCAITKSVA